MKRLITPVFDFSEVHTERHQEKKKKAPKPKPPLMIANNHSKEAAQQPRKNKRFTQIVKLKFESPVVTMKAVNKYMEQNRNERFLDGQSMFIS